jgi:protein TonB
MRANIRKWMVPLMFEQSVCVVSGNGAVARGTRWTVAGSILLQCCLAAVVVVAPLLHPEGLVLRGTAPRVFVPLQTVKPDEVKVKHVEAANATAQAAVLAAIPERLMTAPGLIPHGIGAGDPPPMGVTGTMDGLGGGLPGDVARLGDAPRPAVVARTEVRGPVRVSSGVGAGMLVTPIRPVYPAIARAAHVEGAVVVAATISREGVLERAHVVSGPAMLAGAAMDAVRSARYTPYRLNGEAIEVETTITVNFRMGG